jgi:hypothetical protein
MVRKAAAGVVGPAPDRFVRREYIAPEEHSPSSHKPNQSGGAGDCSLARMPSVSGVAGTRYSKSSSLIQATTFVGSNDIAPVLPSGRLNSVVPWPFRSCMAIDNGCVKPIVAAAG